MKIHVYVIPVHFRTAYDLAICQILVIVQLKNLCLDMLYINMFTNNVKKLWHGSKFVLNNIGILLSANVKLAKAIPVTGF